MRRRLPLALFCFAICTFMSILHADEKGDALMEELNKLDWKGAGVYSLSKSHSRMTVPEGSVIVFDEDARKERNLCDPGDNKSVEAVMYDQDTFDCFIFNYFDEGYVTMDDWDDLDPKQLISSIRDATEEGNKEKVKLNAPKLHVIGWIQEPKLDRTSNTVNWAVEIEEEGNGVIVNVDAFKFGLKGYERVTWVTDKSNYVSHDTEFQNLLSSYRFEKGYRYNEFKTGDKVATFGIATLVATSVGVQLLKSGGVLFILKKAMIFIVSAIGAALYKLRSYFKKKPQ